MYCHIEVRGPQALELPALLARNPDRLFEVETLGTPVRVFFPVHQQDKSRVVVLFWPDPRSLNRKVSKPARRELIDPRAYTANSLFCQALKSAFYAMLGGHRTPPAHLMERRWRFELVLSPVCTWLSADRVVGLFESLGYQVELTPVPTPELELNVRHPRIHELKLEGEARLPDVVRQLLVMMMVIDSDRHDYMGQPDVDRLRRLGADWLETHPERSFIISRYLIYRRLIEGFGQAEGDAGGLGATQWGDGYEASGEPQPMRMGQESQRAQHLIRVLSSYNGSAGRLLVVGCGDGRLLSEMLGQGTWQDVVVLDPSSAAIEKIRKKLDRTTRYGQALRTQATRFDAIVSAPGFSDARLQGFDVVVLPEPIERQEESRFQLTLQSILQDWQPRKVLMTLGKGSDGRGIRETRSVTEALAEPSLPWHTLCTRLASERGYSIEVQGVESGSPSGGVAFWTLTLARGGKRSEQALPFPLGGVL